MTSETTHQTRRLYVKVAVNSGRPNFRTFSYHVPVGRQVDPGEVVHVPWGQRKLQGVVIEGPMNMPGYAGPTRALESPLEGAVLIPPHRLELAIWIADYYFAPLWDSCALMLPPGASERPRTSLVRSSSNPTGLSQRQQFLYDGLSDKPRDMDELRSSIGREGFDVALRSLLRRGLVERRYSLGRPRGRPRVVQVVKLDVSSERALAYVRTLVGRRSSPHARVLGALIEAATSIPFDQLSKIARRRQVVESMIDDGLLERTGNGHENVHLLISVDEAEARMIALTRSRQQTVAAAILERLAANPETPLPLVGLSREVGTGARTTIEVLRTEGVVRVDEVLERRDPLQDLEFETLSPVSLVGDQRAVADSIRSAIDQNDGSRLLLHGVTGSGKTEVYLEALRHAVQNGKRGIVLVPEIALTPQTVRRFAERFPGRVGVLHSGLSVGEAYDEWQAIASGSYDVVVGARSAIFAPQPELGLIVVDEAHEWTYKQQDPSPRYDARVVATRLGRLTGAAVVFGTATPDAEHWYAAVQGEGERALKLLDLPHRLRAVTQPDGADQVWPVATGLPDVEIVDVRASRSLFSEQLLRALDETIERDEQAILFLNRRGLAGFLLCRNGHSPVCTSCDVTLTLHDGSGRNARLACHQCNRSRPGLKECPQCSAPLRQAQAGTQRVEREVMKHFPNSKVLRWDRDTARRPHQHREIMGRFERHEADVLVGTQMIAKGLDFPLVTLVGVILADLSLREGDFRARERTFQLLEQVSGRAGRSQRPGRVLIQTLSPQDPAIELAAAHDLPTFFDQELSWRAEHGYPPFQRMIRLMFSHQKGDYAAEEARRLHSELSRVATGLPDVEVLGPSRPSVARLRGRHRWTLLIRGSNPAALLRRSDDRLDMIDIPPGWIVDVDPVTIV